MIPTLDAYRVYDTQERSTLWVWCRYCCKWHYHGTVGENVGDGDGHRVAHCASRCSPYRRTGYYVREVTTPRERGVCSRVACEDKRGGR